ncbi:MAG: glycosyltransferase family 39 protein [Elusimicrobia bacterium]|nr:glycosyltransferase family 39 protein [Elusimicrobiota bacterium]
MPSRRALWMLLAAVALLPFVDLGHPLWEVDDARYAEIPREMVERGDWLSPTLNYLDYVEKPPLPYWLGCLSYKVFGVSEAAARLPLALFGLLALAATAWLGAWLFTVETGLAAAAILGTCVQFSALTHALTPDLPLTAALAWTSALWLRAMRRPEDAAWAGTGAGIAMGAAVLCKGLVGLVFPVAWALGLAVLFPDLRQGLRRSVLGSGLVPAFLLVAAPWFAVMERRHPGFLAFFFGEQHFQRFLAGASKYRRSGAWHYFVPVELAGSLPWTPAILAALGTVAARWRSADRRLVELALWAAGVFAFFSISSSKLPTYITPLFPHQCLIAAHFLLAQGEDRRLQAWRRGLAFGLGGLLLLALPALPSAVAGVAGEPLPPAALAAGIATAGALAGGTLALCLADPLRRLAVPAALGGLAACAALGGARVAERWISARPLAAAIARELRPGDRIISYGIYLHALPFYTLRPVDLVNWVGELHYAKRDPANAGRFGDDDTIRRLPRAGGSTFVALRRKEAPWVTTLAEPGEIAEMLSFGAWALVRFPPARGDPGATAGPAGRR